MKIGIFFGCTTRSTPYLYDNLKKFLEKASVDYVPLGENLCCGAPLLLAGKLKEARDQAEKVRASAKGLETIVTPCPHCYSIIKKEYPELTGRDNDFNVIHLTQFIKSLLDEGKIKFSSKFEGTITYHDPCYIGRMGDGIYDEPREVIQSIPGIHYKELEFSKEDSTCCGGGGFVRAYLPRLSAEVAKEKITQQIEPKQIEFVTSSCPFCYLNLKDGADETNVHVMDIVELILKAME